MVGIYSWESSAFIIVGETASEGVSIDHRDFNDRGLNFIPNSIY